MVPQRLDLVEHVRRGRLQVVQTGTFGPQFYGLADDPEVYVRQRVAPRVRRPAPKSASYDDTGQTRTGARSPIDKAKRSGVPAAVRPRGAVAAKKSRSDSESFRSGGEG